MQKQYKNTQKRLNMQIQVKYGDKKKIKEMYKTSYLTIRRSLSYKTNTPLAKKIRKTALDLGGCIVNPI